MHQLTASQEGPPQRNPGVWIYKLPRGPVLEGGSWRGSQDPLLGTPPLGCVLHPSAGSLWCAGFVQKARLSAGVVPVTSQHQMLWGVQKQILPQLCANSS